MSHPPEYRKASAQTDDSEDSPGKHAVNGHERDDRQIDELVELRRSAMYGAVVQVPRKLPVDDPVPANPLEEMRIVVGWRLHAADHEECANKRVACRPQDQFKTVVTTQYALHCITVENL